MVFDDVRELPTGDEPFVSSDYVICIGHRGRIELMYDDIPDYSEQHTVAVIFPNHSLRKINVTDDYLATLIIVEASVLNDPMLQIINQKRYRYEPHPNVKLDKHEYRMIMNVVEGTQAPRPADADVTTDRILPSVIEPLPHEQAERTSCRQAG